ncbi:MAG TPA: imidazole glycerol phosphate synthase subunit HisH [Cyclobacteriaceae bacterium]|nr:imidazole glycerol phosphate synthase subunit HisH [Cyclobacteriaceae bacterium]
MHIAVIKYNAGNIRSVAFALDRLGVSYSITDVPDEITSADRVIFPGVGEASSTMRYLRDHHLDKIIQQLTQPTLGICLGMQLMCSFSEENNTTCLGIFEERVLRFQGSGLKVPHMGWNSLDQVNNWLEPGLQDQFVYFVHSYFVPVCGSTTAQTTYGQPFSAALRKGNFHAVQFHPEKSAETGVIVIRNFLNSQPTR